MGASELGVRAWAHLTFVKTAGIAIIKTVETVDTRFTTAWHPAEAGC
jgi:hypothetical protein